MSKIDASVRFRHMLDAAREALSFASEKSQADIENDRMLELALIKEIEIIGEAAGKIAEETRAKFPQLPWKMMTGMRNILVHQYDEADEGVIWSTVTEDLPPLVAALEKILTDLET